MARRPTKPTPEAPTLTFAERQAAIQRFQARIAELETFDVAGMNEEHPTELSTELWPNLGDGLMDQAAAALA